MSFLRRLAVLPFEVLIAGLVIVSGSLALLHIGGLGQDALSVQLPDWLNVASNLTYLLAGLAMFSGIGLARGDIEAAGLVGISAGVIIRAVALVWFVGWSGLIIVTVSFNMMVVIACGVRLSHIAGRKTVILAESTHERRQAPR